MWRGSVLGSDGVFAVTISYQVALMEPSATAWRTSSLGIAFVRLFISDCTLDLDGWMWWVTVGSRRASLAVRSAWSLPYMLVWLGIQFMVMFLRCR